MTLYDDGNDFFFTTGHSYHRIESERSAMRSHWCIETKRSAMLCVIVLVHREELAVIVGLRGPLAEMQPLADSEVVQAVRS